VRAFVYTLVLLLAWIADARGDERIAFKNLQPGQTITVEYGLVGSWVPADTMIYELMFTGMPRPIVSVVRVELKWSHEKQRRVIAQSVPVGSYSLTREEFSSLDPTLEAYRLKSLAGPPRDTGNHERVIVKLIEDAKVIRREIHFSDPGKAPGGQNSIPSVIRRAVKAGKTAI
jgi:hypothetical protein